jgi:redox-sensitive bicupin YhaK (pirin superfamily)
LAPPTVQATDNHDVRPHPHIGLATVTYLFGARSCTATAWAAVQQIEPGAINWMTAGRGIVHSERRPARHWPAKLCQPRHPAVVCTATRI